MIKILTICTWEGSTEVTILRVVACSKLRGQHWPRHVITRVQMGRVERRVLLLTFDHNRDFVRIRGIVLRVRLRGFGLWAGHCRKG